VAGFDDKCCFACDGVRGNKQWVAAYHKFCSAKPETKDCPKSGACALEVPGPQYAYLMAMPTCKAGHCK
jgi:hypothetical protein